MAEYSCMHNLPKGLAQRETKIIITCAILHVIPIPFTDYRISPVCQHTQGCGDKFSRASMDLKKNYSRRQRVTRPKCELL